jgi:antitoxin HigA-1
MAKKLPPVHPGEVLREEFLELLGISINTLARELHVPFSRISKIVNEESGGQRRVGHPPSSFAMDVLKN